MKFFVLICFFFVGNSKERVKFWSRKSFYLIFLGWVREGLSYGKVLVGDFGWEN